MMNAAAAATEGSIPGPVADASIVNGVLAQSLLAWARQQGLALGVKLADDGRYLLVNLVLAELLGRSQAEIVGRSDAELLDPAAAALMRAADHTALVQGSALASMHQRELAHQGPREASGDPYDQAQFDDQLRRELDLSAREHREFALVYITIDTDQPGALAHDRVCEAMGHLLRGNTRAMDSSCRIGPQRFAVLLSGVGLATAHSRMEGLRRQCATQIVVLAGEALRFSVSMGVASYPHTASSQAELMAASSAALDEAQRRGGNGVALARIRLQMD